MENENDIDQLFKNGLSDPEIPFNELDWEKMERKLDGTGEKKHLIPMWLYTVTGIAAVLTVVVFWLLSSPAKIDKKGSKELSSVQPVKPGIKEQVAENNKLDLKMNPAEHKMDSADTNIYQGTAEQRYSRLQAVGKVSDGATARGLTAEQELSALRFLSVVTANDGINSGVMKSVKLIKPQVNLQVSSTLAHSDKDAADVGTAAERDRIALEKKANALAQSEDPLEKITTTEIARSVQKNMESALSSQNTLILSAMAAPDISTAKQSKSSKVSSNLGMLATYAFSPKFSLTSGAIYAKKYYNSAGTAPQDNPYAAAQDWEVDADCNVLDIPLNVNYKLLNKKRLSVSVNTGLSSYFMLKEKYEFITGAAGAGQQVSTLEVQNQNKHLFGIANVSISFDHQINNAFSVGVQPFAKLPLTGIGNGNVDLKSVGVSFSLNIGLFPAKKTGKYAAVKYSALK